MQLTSARKKYRIFLAQMMHCAIAKLIVYKSEFDAQFADVYIHE